MEVVATISTRLFCLSVELRTKNSSSSIPASAWWVAPLLPALLAFLLHATVIRPLAVAVRRHCLNLKLDNDTCGAGSTWLRLLSKVTSQVLRILVSEQTSLWLLYLVAPHRFDINVRLKVEVGTIRAMMHLLLNNTARLLLQLLRVSTADANAAAAVAAADGRQPRVRQDGPRRSARHRRPSVRVAGPEWDMRIRG